MDSPRLLDTSWAQAVINNGPVGIGSSAAATSMPNSSAQQHQISNSFSNSVSTVTNSSSSDSNNNGASSMGSSVMTTQSTSVPVGVCGVNNGANGGGLMPGAGSGNKQHGAVGGVDGPTSGHHQHHDSISNSNAGLAIKEPALLSDNWGQSVINQDKAWDLPPSPESCPKEINGSRASAASDSGNSSSNWKQPSATISTSGTEIWENTVRHKTKGLLGPNAALGGQNASSAHQMPSSANGVGNMNNWNHQPINNHGGTWGDPDEDSPAVWRGVPSQQQQHHNHQQQHQQQQQQQPPLKPSSTGNWGISETPNLATSVQNTSNNAWDKPRSEISAPSSRSWGTGSQPAQPTATNSWGDATPSSSQKANADDGTAVWGGGQTSSSNNVRIHQQQQQPHPTPSAQPNMPEQHVMSSGGGSAMTGQHISSSNAIGTWSTPASNKPRVGGPSGWDDGDTEKSNNIDDGTAVWGKPAPSVTNKNRWNSETDSTDSGNNLTSAKPIKVPSPGGSGIVAGGPYRSDGLIGTSGGGVNTNPSMILSSPGPGMIRLPPGAFPSSVAQSKPVPSSLHVSPQQQPQQPMISQEESWMRASDNGSHNSNVGGRGWIEGTQTQRSTQLPLPAPNAREASSWGAPGEMNGISPSEHQVLGRSMPGTPSAPRGGVSSWGEYSSFENRSRTVAGGGGGGFDWEGPEHGRIDTRNWDVKQKPLSREMICASKNFKTLMEMGFKRDEVETALRNSNLNLEDALTELRILRGAEVMNDRITASLIPAPGGASGTHSIMSRPVGPLLMAQLREQQQQREQQNAAAAAAAAAANNSQFMTGAHNAQSFGGSGSGGGSGGGGSLGVAPRSVSTSSGLGYRPSEKQLTQLVQQIQLAVQTGHLNAQILNQPLAPPTIQLIYQLLQQIRVLQQLQAQLQSQLTQPGGGMGARVPGMNSPYNQSALHVQITQAKQRISNLQNNIHVQQAVFLKQQIQQPGTGSGSHLPPSAATAGVSNAFPHHPDVAGGGTGDGLVLSSAGNKHSPSIDQMVPASLQTIGTGKSRLDTWKFPDDGSTLSHSVGGDRFSRAPGPPSSAKSAMPPTSSTWSGSGGFGSLDLDSGSNSGGGGGVSRSWSSGSEAANDGYALSAHQPNTQSNPHSSSANNINRGAGYDLVPEFEPGKPWKGNLDRRIEDDPHITPADVANSSKWLWQSKPVPTSNSAVGTPSEAGVTTGQGTLSNSTWAYTPSSTQNIVDTLKNNGPPKSSGASWDLSSPTSGGDSFWGSDSRGQSMSKPPRGPPPGLAQIKNAGGVVSMEQGRGGSLWGAPDSGRNWDRQSTMTGPSFLILRNLTPQIDGSTLKTLCMQHGPLQLFHLFLNHGIALVRYSTREEATKAQSALNNCVLGNTTILSDIPSEAEVQQYLHMGTSTGQQSSVGSVTWSGGQTNGARGSTSSSSNGSNNGAGNQLRGLWSYSGSAGGNAVVSSTSGGGGNLWGASLNSHLESSRSSSSGSHLLPGDLLGRESSG